MSQNISQDISQKFSHDVAVVDTPVREGDLLWTPSAAWVADTNLTAFMGWLARERGRKFADYTALWQWSTTDIEDFWQAIWDYFDVRSSAPPRCVLESRAMPGARWFPGARLNYAEHVLRHERPGADAVLALSETRPLTGVPWTKFAADVRTLATQLRALGIKPGDRVAAYLPNIPQAMIAMLATTAVGAIWAVLLARLRLRRRARPAAAIVAETPVLLRRLPLRRQGVRPQRGACQDPRRADRARACRPSAAHRSELAAGLRRAP